MPQRALGTWEGLSHYFLVWIKGRREVKESGVALAWGHSVICKAYLLRSASAKLRNQGRRGRENYWRFIPGAYGISKGRCPVGSRTHTSEASVGGLGWSRGQEGASRTRAAIQP